MIMQNDATNSVLAALRMLENAPSFSLWDLTKIARTFSGRPMLTDGTVMRLARKLRGEFPFICVSRRRAEYRRVA